MAAKQIMTNEKGRIVHNDGQALKNLLKLTELKHEGNFCFQGITKDGKRVLIYTKPHNDDESSIRITGIYDMSDKPQPPPADESEWTKEEEDIIANARKTFLEYAHDLKTKVSTDDMIEKFVDSMMDKWLENFIAMKEWRAMHND